MVAERLIVPNPFCALPPSPVCPHVKQFIHPHGLQPLFLNCSQQPFQLLKENLLILRFRQAIVQENNSSGLRQRMQLMEFFRPSISRVPRACAPPNAGHGQARHYSPHMRIHKPHGRPIEQRPFADDPFDNPLRFANVTEQGCRQPEIR